MAKFITRILLLKGEEKDYETLHREIKDPSILKKKKISVKADKSKKGEKTGRDYSFTIMKNKENYKPGHN